MRDKTHISISVDREKAFDKIKYSFLTKKKTNTTKKRPYIRNPQLTLYYSERWKTFPLRSGKRQVCHTSVLSFHVILKITARTIKQERNKKHPN